MSNDFVDGVVKTTNALIGRNRAFALLHPFETAKKKILRFREFSLF